MHRRWSAVKQGAGWSFPRDSPWVVPDLGPYGTNFNPYDVGNPYGGDVGWFGSKLVKRVGKIARGVGKGIAKGAKVIAPIAAKALPMVQQAMKLTGPIGMLASGAAGALSAAVRGQSLESIAWAAAEGASPPGIDRALAAAKALREGQPVLNVALSQARQQFAPGGAAQRAFDLGVSAAKGGAKGALNSARQQLRTGTEKAAFDAALGTVSKAAHGLPAHPITRPDVLSMGSRVRPALSGFRHPSTALALSALRRRPALRRMSLGDLSRRLNLPARHVADARGLFDDEGLSAYDTGAPGDELGAYTLRAGDTGSGLAKRFTGDANRWRELPSVNKRGIGRYTGTKDMVVQHIKDPKTGKIKTTLLNPFHSGLVINVPPGWAGPGVNAGTPTIVTTPAPGPTPVVLPPEIIVGDAPTPKPPTSMPSPIPGMPPIALPPIPPSLPPGVPVEPTSPIPGMPPGTPLPTGLPGTVPISTGPAKKKDDGAGLALGLASLGLLLM